MAQSDSNAIKPEFKDEKKTLDRVVSNAASDLKAGEVVDFDQVCFMFRLLSSVWSKMYRPRYSSRSIISRIMISTLCSKIRKE